MAGGGGCILPGSTHARTDNNVSYPEAKLGNRAPPPPDTKEQAPKGRYQARGVWGMRGFMRGGQGARAPAKFLKFL